MTVDSNADVQARKRRTLVDALYRKYSQTLMRFLARQRLSREEVADIVQETYCRMHQLSYVESIQYPRAFIFRVASNLARNTEKHRRLGVEQRGMDAHSVEVVAEGPDPYRLLNAEQELSIVRAAFQELSPKCRKVFVMNRFENLSYGQIARELGISTSMIEKYVSQALAHLRTRVAGTGAVSKTLRALK